MSLLIPPELKLALFVGPLLAVGIYAGVQHHEAVHWRGAYADLVATVKLANAQATAIALAQKQAADTRTATIKDRSDAALDTARHDDADRLAAYVRLHRPTTASPARNANMSEPAAAPEVDNGAGGTAVVAQSDLAICDDATTRLINAHDWGATLTAPMKDTR